MREILTIQIGQAGNNIGATFWEQISREHDIDSNGQCSSITDQRLSRSDVYFNETKCGRFVPRAIFTDLDSNSLNHIRAGSSSQFYNADNFISQNSGARNNWAIGHYTRGRELLDQIMDAINKEIELCESFQGCQIIHSISGGTGAGMGSLIMEKIKQQYPDRITVSYPIFPEPGIQDNVVAPYNATLSVNPLVEQSDLCMVIDNKALTNICFKNFNPTPNFQDLNNIISKGICGITAPQRFPGLLNCELKKMAVNVVPYLRPHFLSMATAPISSLGYLNKRQVQVPDLIDQLFQSQSQMCSINLTDGKYMCNQVNFRGNISTSEAEERLSSFKLKNESLFIDWIRNNNSLSISNLPRKDIIISATAIFNTTAISPIFTHLSEQFTAMFRRKAYLHWYLAEGMDEMEFTEAESNMYDFVQEYTPQYLIWSEDQGDVDEDD